MWMHVYIYVKVMNLCIYMPHSEDRLFFTPQFTSRAGKTRPNGNSKSGKQGDNETKCKTYNLKPVEPLTAHCSCTANCKMPCCVWAKNRTRRKDVTEIITCIRQPALPSTFCTTCKCSNGSCKMAKVPHSFFCGERFLFGARAGSTASSREKRFKVVMQLKCH